MIKQIPLKVSLFCLGIIIGLLLITIIIQTQTKLSEFERDYYKEQMIKFCEIDKIQEDIILKLNPNLPLPLSKECDYYLLDKDRSKE